MKNHFFKKNIIFCLISACAFLGSIVGFGFGAYVYADESDETQESGNIASSTDAYEIPEQYNELSYGYPEGDTYMLPVIETSDTHGHLFEITENGIEYRQAFIADKAKDIRGRGSDYRKEKLLLVDGGDIFQGYTASNLFRGAPLSAAYQYMDYDAATIGNHEFDWELPTVIDDDKTLRDYDFGKYKGKNDIPVIACNLYQNDEKYACADDYIIVNKVATDINGNEVHVRIAVIGFADDFAATVSYKKWGKFGYKVDKDFEKVNSLAKQLEDSGMCDATIMLFHGSAKEGATALGDGTAVDLVMGGHTHVCQNNVTPFGLGYVQPGCNGQFYAYAELYFQVIDDKVQFTNSYTRYKKVTQDKNKLYDLPENADELDEDIVNISKEAYDLKKDEINRPIGYITESLLRNEFIDGSGGRACTSGNFYLNIFKNAEGADVSFMNKGGLRKDMVVTGDRRTVTAGDVYDMFTFDDDLIYTYEVTYGDLYDLLYYSLLRQGKGLVSYMTGIKCYYTDTTVNAIQTLDGNVIYINGQWKGDWKDKKLRISVPEFIATTDRNDEEPHNPFLDWNMTDRLINANLFSTETAFRVLEEQASENDDYIYVDPDPYYINDTLEDPYWYLMSDGTLVIEKGIREIPPEKFDDYNDQKSIIFDGTSEEWYAMPIEDRWLIESTDVDIKCTDKTIVAASYMCVNYDEHSWEEPVYNWSDDNNKVTASRVCIACDKEESETVDTTCVVTKEATETEDGEKIYTAEFTNPVFVKQEKSVVIPAKGKEEPTTEEPTTEETTTEATTEKTTEAAGTNTKKNVKSPSTGDETPVAICVILLIMSMSFSTIITKRNRSS